MMARTSFQATGLTTALVDPANPTASVADLSLTNLVVKGVLNGAEVASLDTAIIRE
jgi:hypothetical protein